MGIDKGKERGSGVSNRNEDDSFRFGFEEPWVNPWEELKIKVLSTEDLGTQKGVKNPGSRQTLNPCSSLNVEFNNDGWGDKHGDMKTQPLEQPSSIT